MKKLITLIVTGGCFLSLNSFAIDLKQAKFTQVVNKVAVFSAQKKISHPVVVNDIFKMPDLLRTGPNSRAELVAADDTITRVGANTIFSYDNANRTIDLEQGSLLFHSPHGKGGGTIRTPSASAGVIGTTIIVTCTPDGGFKVLDLEGEVQIIFRNGLRQTLEPGEMTFVLPGGKERAPILIFRLDEEIEGSLLVSGFTQPLPSMPRINTEVTRQLVQILNNQAVDTGLLAGNSATPGQVQAILDDEPIVLQNLPSLILNGATVNKSGSVNIGGGTVGVSLTGGTSVTSTSGDVGITAGGDVNVTAGTSVTASSGNVGVSTSGDVNVGDSSLSASGSVNVASGGSVSTSGSTVNGSVNTTLSAGDVLSLSASVVTAINLLSLSGVNGVAIAGTTITASDPSLGEADISTGGNITVGGGTTIQAPTIILNAGGGIALDGTGGNFTGNIIDVIAGNTATVQNADLTALSTVNISAHTINLINVQFGGTSTVNLQSFYGVLAPLPNSNLPSVPGDVNFIHGVTYGGTTITFLNEGTFVTAGTGPGIHISAQP